MSKEVSCACLYQFFDPVKKKNIPKKAWLKGIPHSINYLQNEHERIDWEEYCRICDNIRPYFSDDDFIEMGRVWAMGKARDLRALIIIPFLLFEREDLSCLIQKYVEKPASKIFTCIDYKTESLGHNAATYTLKVKNGYPFCRDFFLISYGSLTVLFNLLGRKAINVTIKWIEQGAIYEIICVKKDKRFSKIINFLLQPFKARFIAKELEEAHVALLDKCQEQENAQIVLQRQTLQLKTAFKINQQIRRNLDLNLVLDSIVQAMVNDAGFKAAKISITTNLPDKGCKKVVSFGEIPNNVQSSVQSLKIENDTIGKIKVWSDINSSADESIELLKQMIPTIILAIHDAISYQTVIDCRNNLELKVEERTAKLKKTRDDLAKTIELLKKTQHSRDRFFTNISHEFRTPLTLIEGPVKQLLEGSFKGNVKEHYELILRNTKRLLNLVNQLLYLSRIDASHMKLKLSHLNIVLLLKSLTMTFESKAVQKKISLEFEAAQECIPVNIDREHFETIIINLLSNAINFTPKEGTIKVLVGITPSIPPLPRGKIKEGVCISIFNSGSYIPPEKIIHIFDRFYQADDSHKQLYESTGIGLSLTKELVELNMGSISVESNVESGTTFIILLPLDQYIQRKHTTADLLQSTGPNHNEGFLYGTEKIIRRISPIKKPMPLIMIVEDNPDVRYYIRGYLDSTFQIIETCDGIDGFETALNLIPDLIISDVMMPVMDGFEFCKKIKIDERTCHIPLILLTARAHMDDKIEGLKYGADDYLTKPFNVKELLARINSLLKQREQLRKYYSKNFKLDPNIQCETSACKSFYNRAHEIVESHLSDTHFTIKQFAREIGFSQPQLTRKLEALTGMSPSRFIRSRRLLCAKTMLEKLDNSVSQVAFECGFNNLSYFSRSFKQQFGQLPSECIRQEVYESDFRSAK